MRLHRLFHSDFARKIAGTFAAQFLGLLISLISAVLISRTLGPTFRGMYAVAITISAIGMQFGNLGLHSANTYFLARDPTLLPAVVGNTLATGVVLGLICALGTWAFCLMGDPLLQGPLLLLAVFWIPFSLTHMLFQNVLLGLHEVKAFNFSELMNRILQFLLMFALIGWGFRNVNLLFLVNYFSLAAALFYVFYKIRGRLQGKPHLSSELFQGSLSYAIKVYLSCLVAFFVIRCDLLFAKYFFDFEQAGYYSVASSAIDIISMFPMTISTLLFPKLSSFHDPQEKRHYFKKIGKIVFFLMGGGALVLFAIAKPVIRLVYGPLFLPAVPIFLWLLPGMVLASIDRICCNYLSAMGMPWVCFFFPLLSLMAKVGLNFHLVPSFGVIGVAISSSLCYGLMLALNLLYIYSRKGEALESHAKL